MDFQKCVENVQRSLKEYNLDAWLIYDFRGSNPFLKEIFHLSWHATRRFFLLIPKEGEVEVLSHAIESAPIEHLNARKKKFSSYIELESHLKEWIKRFPTLAMEYSYHSHIPSLCKLDAGTYEWLTALGAKIVSSQNILSHLYVDQIDLSSHLDAAKHLSDVFLESFEWLQKVISAQGATTERSLQGEVCRLLKSKGLVSDDLPICAVNANSAKPHYEIVGEGMRIEKGSLVLLDIWGRLDKPFSVFADMTQMAVVGRKPTSKEKEVFSVVYEAQREAIAFMQSKDSFKGLEVDQVARNVIKRHHMAEFFTHRVGHSIGQQLHGSLANLDSYETIDERIVLPGSCFSIEPGVYLPHEFGIRLECDAIFTKERQLMVTTPRQAEFIELPC